MDAYIYNYNNGCCGDNMKGKRCPYCGKVCYGSAAWHKHVYNCEYKKEIT